MVRIAVVAAAVALASTSGAIATPTPLSDIQLVTSQRSTSSVAAGQPFSHFVRCPTGKKVLGGGYSIDTPQSGFLVTVNGPSTNRETWTFSLRNVSSTSIAVVVTVAATCASG